MPQTSGGQGTVWQRASEQWPAVVSRYMLVLKPFVCPMNPGICFVYWGRKMDSFKSSLPMFKVVKVCESAFHPDLPRYFIFNSNWKITISYRWLCLLTQPNYSYDYIDHWNFPFVTRAWTPLWLICGETRWLDRFFTPFARQPLLLSVSLALQ